jgi:hypothetical protein
MPVEMLTYAALGARLNCSPEAARSLAKRLRQLANDGEALVVVGVAELAHKPTPARSPAGDHPITVTLKAHVEALQAGAPSTLFIDGFSNRITSQLL